MSLLLVNNKIFRLAFEHGLWGLWPVIVKTGKINIQASCDELYSIELENYKKVIKDGLILFEKIFEYKSKSFIANNFVWDTNMNPILKEHGIAINQGMKY